MTSSILVNLAEDADLRLISLLAPEVGAAADAPPQELMRALCTSSSAMTVLSNLPEEDAVGALSLLAGLLQRCTTESDETKKGFVQTIMNAIVGTATAADVETTERKMNLLSVLYNLLANGSSTLHCMILARIFKVAATQASTLLAPESSLGRLLVGEHPPLVQLVKSWNTTDRCALYETICAIPENTARTQRFLLLLLQEQPHNVDLARRVALGTMQDPVTWFRWQRSLLTVPAIQALQQKEPDLYKLLVIFQQGTLSDYKAFVGKQEDKLLKQFKLHSDDCQRSMRLLTLCSLAGQHDEIPYAAIQTALAVDTVESWVVEAVKSGLLQAKMDQLSQKVMVERCVVRQFDQEQWKKVQARLVMWKENVANVLAALDKSSSSTAVPSS